MTVQKTTERRLPTTAAGLVESGRVTLTTPAPDATALEIARDYGAAWLTEKHVYDLVAEIERLRHSRSVIYEKYCDLLVQLGGADA